MDEAHRLAEAKAEELRIQAERALKQQEADEREREERRRLDNRFYNPGGSVFLNAQFTPNGDDRLDLTYNDLFHSPHFLNASRSFQGSHTSIAAYIPPSVSAQYSNERDTPPVAGKLAWALHPDQMNGHMLYQDIDPTTPYGALTIIEMCNIGSIDYKLNYRDHNHFATALQTTSSLPNPLADSENVSTKHIFKKWVEDVLAKFQTRYPNVLLCILRPNPLNDPDVRRFYSELMPLKSKSNLSGSTTEVKLKVRNYLQTRVSDYNQANHFLAEVITHTVSKQQSIFFHLHSHIISNKNQLQHDAHTLFMLSSVL